MIAGAVFPTLKVNLVVQICVFLWLGCTCNSFFGGGEDVGVSGVVSCCYNWAEVFRLL